MKIDEDTDTVMTESSDQSDRLHIFNFPDELLERIIVHMCAKDILRLEITCKRAQDICRWLYWSRFRELNLVVFLRTECRVDVSNAYRFDLSAAGLMKRCGAFLRRLDISKFGPLEYGLRLGLEHAVIEHCSQLHSIDIDNRLLERGWLLKLSAATGRSLRRLSISHVYIRNCGGLDDALLGSLLRQWRHLETLIARDNKQLRMSCTSEAPRTLRSLDIMGCSVHPSHVQALMGRCPRLNSLSLTLGPEFGQLPTGLAERMRELVVDSSGSGSLFTMHENYVNTAVANMTSVKQLTVSSHLVNDLFFQMVAKNLSDLEQLRIPGARPGYLSSVTFSLLELTSLPKLSYIGLCGNPMGRTLLMMCFKFKHLLVIDASYSVKERDMIDSWQDIKSETLQTLILRGFCSPTQDKATMTRRLLPLLRVNCPKLTSVVL